MLAPAVTPELAERALIGAAVHAFSVRASTRAAPADHNDLEFARRIPSPDELAESATVYAISLVWWAYPDREARRALLREATDRLLSLIASSTEQAYEVGYRIYASHLARATLAPLGTADQLNVRSLVCGVAEIDLMTARFADTAVHAVLLSDQHAFGDPASSAELMRDQMIQLAFCAA